MNILKKVLLKIRIPFAVVLIFLFAVFIFPFATVGRSFLLITELVPVISFKPLEMISAQPVAERVEIPLSSSGMMIADIYRPSDEKKHPSAIFAEYGLDPESEAVSNFAKSLARSGFAVLVPVNQDFEDISLKVEHAQNFIDSFEFMSKKSYVDQGKMGFVGICAAGSLSLIAAGNDQIANRVKFVVALSPYYDGHSIYSEVYTKSFNENGKVYNWNPNLTTLKALEGVLINSLPDNEREVLSGVMYNGEPLSELDNLTEARNVYDFMRNTNSENFAQSFDELPLESKETVVELSPSHDIQKVKGKVFIIFDNRDNFIPNIESRELARNLPAAQKEVVFIDLLEHSQLTRNLPRLTLVGQLAKLGVFIYKILDFVK